MVTLQLIEGKQEDWSESLRRHVLLDHHVHGLWAFPPAPQLAVWVRTESVNWPSDEWRPRRRAWLRGRRVTLFRCRKDQWLHVCQVQYTALLETTLEVSFGDDKWSRYWQSKTRRKWSPQLYRPPCRRPETWARWRHLQTKMERF